MKPVDKNGKELSEGDEVIMPEPDDAFHDCHDHSFQGSVFAIEEDGLISVVDDHDEIYAVEANRVELV